MNRISIRGVSHGVKGTSVRRRATVAAIATVTVGAAAAAVVPAFAATQPATHHATKHVAVSRWALPPASLNGRFHDFVPQPPAAKHHHHHRHHHQQRHQPTHQRPASQTASRTSYRTPITDPRTAAHALVLQHGWSESEWSCLDALWTRESGWIPSASNASSGAYGIPQALPGSKMATFGADWQTNPVSQIKWGLWYISVSYGTPCAALSHENSVGYY